MTELNLSLPSHYLSLLKEVARELHSSPEAVVVGCIEDLLMRVINCRAASLRARYVAGARCDANAAELREAG